MKFIKISFHPESAMASIPPNFVELVEANCAWKEMQKQAGKLLEDYFLPGDGRTISIWEFESPEEIDKNLWEDPLSAFFDSKFYPAADVFEHIKNIKKMMGK